DLGRVDDSGPYHVHVLIRLGVEPLREVLGAPDLLHDDGPLEAGILHDLSEWLLERSPPHVDAGPLIVREREAAGPLEAGILHDLSEWLLERSPHDVDAGRLIAGEREAVESRRGSEQSDPAARHDALLHRGPGRVERVLHAGLLL